MKRFKRKQNNFKYQDEEWIKDALPEDNDLSYSKMVHYWNLRHFTEVPQD